VAAVIGLVIVSHTASPAAIAFAPKKQPAWRCGVE